MKGLVFDALAEALKQLTGVTMRTGTQIVFCGHHYAKHGPKITQVAVVYDERDRVEVESSPTRITQGAPLLSAT